MTLLTGECFLFADLVAACTNQAKCVALREWKFTCCNASHATTRLICNPKSESSKRMKTAYELAMERLNQAAPAAKLTNAQKKQLAELDSTYAAKIAGREITLKDEIAKMAATGDSEKVEALQQQLTKERKSLQSELEEKKEQVRHPAE